jgi:hypothetical protein
MLELFWGAAMSKSGKFDSIKSDADANGFTDLALAFSILKQMRAERVSAFPFLTRGMDYALLLYIGEEQAHGRRMNMNHILTSGIGTPSTLIRRMTELEAAAVVRKSRSGTDKRNTYYELTETPMSRVPKFMSCLSQLLLR